MRIWHPLRRGIDWMTRLAADHRRLLAAGTVVFVVAAFAFRWARRSAGFWGIDDAGITYAAALEYADHGSLAANVEGTPVESYSNPLVFFVATGLRLLGLFDPITTHVRLEMMLFAVMVVLMWSTLRQLFCSELAAAVGAALFAAIELLTPATWLWYGSGLENVWVSTGLVGLLWIWMRAARGIALAPGWGAAAFLVALTRPEAPVYVAGFYVALAFARPPETTWTAHARRVGAGLAVTTVLYAGFLCWRRTVYGDWLPNTYYAKIFGEPSLLTNLRVWVIGDILPYAHCGLFASSAVALLFVRRFARIAAALLTLLAVSIALPLFAGEDFFMGEHRYATAFIAASHACCAVFVTVCIAGLASTRRRGRVAALAGLIAVAVPTVALAIGRSRRGALYLDDVTIARVGELEGGERWEHQMRLGVPYAVTMLPDAGGSMLVGGMQYLDNAYLADFVMAHMGRYFGSEYLRRQLNQYQHEERRPDLVSPSTAIGAIDTSYLGTRYLQGAQLLLGRRDLVEVPAIDPAARPVFDAGHLRVYLSNETVLTAARGALVRCELIVAWDAMTLDDHLAIRGAVDGGDRDEISLRPYQPGASGIERRALLLGAPDRAGAAAVTLEITRDGSSMFRDRVATLEVAGDDAAPARAAEQILGDSTAMRAARRLAWLREQLISRLGMTRFHAVTRSLLGEHARHGSLAGANLLLLRHNARLATFERLPVAIRSAEVAVTRLLFATCPATVDPATRVVCLGRVVDELRRLGYLGTLARVPEIAEELSRARAGIDRWPPAQRYQVLVGLTLADPSDIALERELLAQRRVLERYPELPSVTDRLAR